MYWKVLIFLEEFCKGHISAEKGSLVCTDFSYASDHECPLIRAWPNSYACKTDNKTFETFLAMISDCGLV